MKLIKNAAKSALNSKNTAEHDEALLMTVTLVALLFTARDAYDILSANILFNERKEIDDFATCSQAAAMLG